MDPLDLFKAGKLDEAISALNERVRRDPSNGKLRTFLFELLCFSGDYERARKQLDVLGQSGPQAELGALLYRSALEATRTREDLFARNAFPGAQAQPGLQIPVQGTLNGSPFESLLDADPRIGANLEVFAAGKYLWIPFSFLSFIEISPPRRLRDLLWIPAVVRPSPAFQETELGEVLLPALCPFSWKHPDHSVRLGRETAWEGASEGKSYPLGQKMLFADAEEVPILEIRRLEFSTAAAA